MTDLQDALDKYDKTGSAYGNVRLFVEAARRVANLDYKAAVKQAARSNKRRNSDGFNEWVQSIVNAALSITEDE